MSSADLATVVIACPNCGTRYQVPFATLGAGGREVQCAQCGKPWHAKSVPPPPAPPRAPAPVDPDALFGADDEDALDRAFEQTASLAAAAAEPEPGGKPLDPGHARTLAEIRAAIAPKPKKPAASPPDDSLQKAKQSFDRRQADASRRLPLARMRRGARLGAVAALALLLVGGFVFRTEIVSGLPSLAGVYAAIGLPVNVVGLQFDDAKTLSSLRDGKTVMQITAKIRSIAGQTVSVPPVLVSLLNTDGATLYEWTVNAQAKQLDGGEILDFSTEVTSPPDGATRVRLSFTTSRDSDAGPAQGS
jgi:predicted Zn finger-like uncharacterized protein